MSLGRLWSQRSLNLLSKTLSKKRENNDWRYIRMRHKLLPEWIRKVLLIWLVLKMRQMMHPKNPIPRQKHFHPLSRTPSCKNPQALKIDPASREKETRPQFSRPRPLSKLYNPLKSSNLCPKICRLFLSTCKNNPGSQVRIMIKFK